MSTGGILDWGVGGGGGGETLKALFTGPYVIIGIRILDGGNREHSPCIQYMAATFIMTLF